MKKHGSTSICLTPVSQLRQADEGQGYWNSFMVTNRHTMKVEIRMQDHPELKALLERYKGYRMTRDEIATQRKSWVIGELLLQYLEMTRDEAERIYDGAT